MQEIPGESSEQSDNRVKAAIAGRAPLPWEAKVEGSEEKLKKLRGLKRTVRRLPCFLEVLVLFVVELTLKKHTCSLTCFAAAVLCLH